jgi:hypothetical protein
MIVGASIVNRWWLIGYGDHNLLFFGANLSHTGISSDIAPIAAVPDNAG